MGVFEIPEFGEGTIAIAEAMALLGATTIIGGGDSVTAVKQAGLAGENDVYFHRRRRNVGITRRQRASRRGRVNGKRVMRKKIVAANWKMNMTQGEAERFMESFLRDVGEITDVEVVIIPPFTAIAKVSEALGRAQNIKVGAQNMYWEKSGPYTGEISAPLLRDLFVHYVVLGHSERRTLFGETDEMVNRKVRAAHRSEAATDCLRRRNARAA